MLKPSSNLHVRLKQNSDFSPTVPTLVPEKGRKFFTPSKEDDLIAQKEVLPVVVLPRVSKARALERRHAILALSLAFQVGAFGMNHMPTLIAAEPITKAEMESLASRGKLKWARIELNAGGGAAARIESIGAIVWTREPHYLIVAADAIRLSKIKKAGYILQDFKETDVKSRNFTVKLSTHDEYQGFRNLVSDTFPASSFPAEVGGRASDGELAWARKAGFAVQIK